MVVPKLIKTVGDGVGSRINVTGPERVISEIRVKDSRVPDLLICEKTLGYASNSASVNGCILRHARPFCIINGIMYPSGVRIQSHQPRQPYHRRKDHGAQTAQVNEWMNPFPIMHIDGIWQSRVRGWY